jgi:hypothetical protein
MRVSCASITERCDSRSPRTPLRERRGDHLGRLAASTRLIALVTT